MTQPPQGAEPPMFLQRPSSTRSQDITHILAKTFRELFTRDSVAEDTVQYLSKSRGSDDIYHEKYVDSLQKVKEERERRLSEVAMLERHIMQAQARAMSADERALNRISSGHMDFPDLGLPPSRSHFRSCIDTELLRKHNLVTPEDFFLQEPPIVPPPRKPNAPEYTHETVTSSKKRRSNDGLDKDISALRPVSSNSDLSSDNSSLDVGAPRTEPAARVWENQVNAEQREKQKTALSNLQAKVDYLKNPRHLPPAVGGDSTLIKAKRKSPKELGIKPKSAPPASSEDNTPVFLPSPPVIRFSNYAVGQVYEMTLELKNVTRAMRPVRIVPPRTTFFSVGLGQFPGEQGLVAPGMCCHYTIRFNPDSLSDFDDYVTVQTQASSPLIIPLQGRRPPPVITLPENIMVGPCLVGGCRITRFIIINDGGPGRFCMMKRESWPASNFKRTVASSSVHMPPFEVRPAVFEMDRGAKVIIEVLFSPKATVMYSEQFSMVCDNCHVRHFTVTGEGQTAGVELLFMEGGLSASTPGEICDVSAGHLVRFDTLNPYTYYQRALHIKNLSDIDLPFAWVVVKPLLKPPDPEKEGAPLTGAQKRVQAVDTAFSIEPQSAVLPAHSIAEFVVTFAPPKIAKFHSVLHLILRHIPRRKMSSLENSSDGISEITLSRRSSLGVGMETQDLTALEVEFKGECQPFSVMLQPYAIYIPGRIVVQTSVKRQFRMLNTSVSSVIFRWDKVNCQKYIIEVEPPMGELGPQEEMEFDVMVSACQAGRIQDTILCHVHHLDEPLTLPIQAEVKGPEVQIANVDVNLGLVRLGEKVQKTVRIDNLCQVCADWEIRESPEHAKLDQMPEFTFSPSGGRLHPLETLTVTVTFTPKVCQSLRTIFELVVQDGNQTAVMVRGEVQEPQACLLKCQLNMNDVYLDVTSLHGIVLLNQTLLPTRFQWSEAEGGDAETCSVFVEPASANLEPREQVQCVVNFTAHRLGLVKDLRVACRVAGMADPLYLSISGNVLGLKVTYTISQSADPPTESSDNAAELLDLGDTQLGESPSGYLHIFNQSAITAPFSLFVDYFTAKPPTPPEARPGNKPSEASQRRALIGRSASMGTYKVPQSGAAGQSEVAKAMLGAKLGAAFLMTPSQGMLPPFSHQTIKVTGFSDMWGDYRDTLHCRVEDLAVKKIPVKMNVSGCPLNFQVVALHPNQNPVVRFGTHISGVKPIVRQMRINNASSFDVRLDWQVFKFDPESNSSQLIELMCTFGKAFPLRDLEGNEIIPEDDPESEFSDSEEEAVPLMPRLPSHILPNSPGGSSTITMDQADPSSCSFPASPGGTRTAAALLVPKVITLPMRKFDGVLNDVAYKVEPKQLVIPAKSFRQINVSLTPFSDIEDPMGTDCIAYALGYMSLADQVVKVDGHVVRREAYEVTPLRLDMTSRIKPALLTLECAEEDGMCYELAASDLLHLGQRKLEHLCVRSVGLSNNTETPLVFRLATTAPFFLVHVAPGTQRPLAHMLQTDEYAMPSRHSMSVNIGFRLSEDLLEYVDLIKAGGKKEGVSLKVNTNEKKLHFEGNLLIQFNNNTIQHLSLSASLTMPALQLSVSSLDFGTCLVGQRRELQFQISNPTNSASEWKVTTDTLSDTCTPETFSITPESGNLEARITYISISNTLIRTFFTAKHNEDYEVVYLFEGILGEQPCRLRVKGQGSYDGKHEALLRE